jgi:uncharacterized membrane protein (UPF0127 family)
MTGFRRLILAGLLLIGMAPALAACAQSEKAPLDGAGQPMEALSVVTASGTHAFWVEIADDDAERARGLMFRPPLEADRGMLFEFEGAGERGFWMKNTPSSLDIVYIGADGKIVSIASHTTPFSEASLPSNGPASGVLEVRAGRMDEIGAKPGDTVRHPFFGN